MRGMRWTRCLGSATVIAIALCLLTGAAASASAPEFGRCLKKAQKSLTPGSYDSGKCIKEASEDLGTEAEKLKKGNWEWLPGPAAGQTAFTITGGVAIWKTVVGKTISCESEQGHGEYSASDFKRATGIVLELKGCTGSLRCTTTGRPTGEIVFNGLAAEVGFQEAARGKTALKLYPETGSTFNEFKCIGLEVKMRGKGGVEGAGILVPIKNDTMTLTDTLKFNAVNGKQKPLVWEGSPTETYMEMNFEFTGWEQAGWTEETTLTNEAKIELNRVL